MPAGTFDIVVLSSSPPIAPEFAPSSPLNASPTASLRRVPMSPLPPLTLSPLASPKKKTSGASALVSREVNIPPDAIRGFATVGSLIRSEHFVQQFGDEFPEKPLVQSRRGSLDDTRKATAATKKSRKRPAKPPAADDDAKSKPKPRTRKPKADKDIATRDPELRLPAPKISPYFANEGADPPIEPPNEHVEAAPKLTKSGKPRKPRAKKEKTEGADLEPKLKKTRVTKPKSAANAAGKAQREETCIESVHFRKHADRGGDSDVNGLGTQVLANHKHAETEDASIWEVPQSPQPKKKRLPKERAPDPTAEGLNLEEAVLRRRDWTPPRDTTVPTPLTNSVGKENKQVEQDANGENFTHLFSNFAYAQAPSAQITVTTTTSTETIAAMKRRRVELVDVPGNQTNSRHSSPEKGKAPKKKPRTITDIATEQYQPRNLSPEPPGVSSNFFEPRATTVKVPLNDVSAPGGKVLPKKPARKRSTSKSDSEKAGSKVKLKKASNKSVAKPKLVAEKLLSPDSALLRMTRQDILFGTSSQLALEESPTIVRHLQLAIKESEQDLDNSFTDVLPSLPQWPRLRKVVGKRELWGASSRDDEGGLLEDLEAVYVPEFDRTQDFPLLLDSTSKEPSAAPPNFVDIDDLGPPPAVVISSDLPTPPQIAPQASQSTQTLNMDLPDHVMKDSEFEDIDNFDSQPPPSNQNVESQNSFVDIDDLDLPPSTQLDIHPPPKPRPPALATTTSSPEKRRHPPKSQSGLPATTASPTSAPKPSIAKGKAMTKKSASAPPATTPRKASGRFIDIDEILDSEDEIMQTHSPTPPRIRKLQDSQPLPLYMTPFSKAPKAKSTALPDPALIQVHRIPTSSLLWNTIKPTLFSAITQHIRSLAPTNNPNKPSWHEKIIMYHPIVLEDFTAYLNTATSIRRWKRAAFKQTRAWNEAMKSMGGETVSVVEWEDMVLAVERELEPSEVRAWCESMSICAIWGQGRGKPGTVRKGYY